MTKKPRTKVAMTLEIISRLLSCAAAFVVLSWELTASYKNKQVLFGATSPGQPTNNYTSPSIVKFLPILATQPFQIQSQLVAIEHLTTQPVVAYVTTDPNDQVKLQTTMCDPGRQDDYLYNISYIEPLLFHALSGDMANASNSWILVDCEYTGILLGDTTCFKIYLVDKQMKTFTTVIAFTLTMDRPLQKLHSTGGVVMATSTPIAALHATDDKRGVTSSERASYYVAVGLTFPYEWSKFEPVILGALNPVVSPWEAQIISTGEEFTMAGTSGFYRGAPNLQASFNTYIWNLASDPIEFASVDQFVAFFVYKDAWGWIRCFLGLGIASNIILNMLVALMVMVHMWQQNRTVWIPDIYTSVQSRAALRGFLLLLDSIWNNWFYPYQYAVQQVENRSVMEGTTFMDAIPRADGLMICLGITYGISRLLGVRVRLFVIVLIYFVSFYYRIDIVNCCGILSKSTSHMAMDLYMANIIPGNGGMDLWAYREDNSINVSLIVNELTWLILACGLCVGYVVLTKLVVSRVLYSKIAPTNSNRVFSVGPHGVNTNSQTEHGQYIFSHLSSSNLKSLLGKTRLERSVRSIAPDIIGLVSRTQDYEDSFYISPSGLWLLGYVILDDHLLININDYIYVVINAVIRRTYFRVYGFELIEDVVAMRTTQIRFDDVMEMRLCNLSLKRMR